MVRAAAVVPAVIHPSADVAPSARIGARTRVWDQVRVREDAVIGADCIIGRGAYIDAGVHVGDRVKIQNAALLYHGVRVADAVFIGPGAILTNDRAPRSVTLEGTIAGSEDWTVTPTQLGEGCSIGAGAIVVAGSDIGAWAMVGAGSVVTHPVGAHALVVGNPARPIGWVCCCGERLMDAAGGRPGPGHEGAARCPRDGSGYRVEAGMCHPDRPA